MNGTQGATDLDFGFRLIADNEALAQTHWLIFESPEEYELDDRPRGLMITFMLMCSLGTVEISLATRESEDANTALSAWANGRKNAEQ